MPSRRRPEGRRIPRTQARPGDAGAASRRCMSRRHRCRADCAGPCVRKQQRGDHGRRGSSVMDGAGTPGRGDRLTPMPVTGSAIAGGLRWSRLLLRDASSRAVGQVQAAVELMSVGDSDRAGSERRRMARGRALARQPGARPPLARELSGEASRSLTPAWCGRPPCWRVPGFPAILAGRSEQADGRLNGDRCLAWRSELSLPARSRVVGLPGRGDV